MLILAIEEAAPESATVQAAMGGDDDDAPGAGDDGAAPGDGVVRGFLMRFGAFHARPVAHAAEGLA